MLMARKLKVWGTNTWFVGPDHPARGLNSTQVRAVIAAPNQREAADALGSTLYEFRMYAAETGNEEDMSVALANPGRVCVQKLDHGDVWYLGRSHEPALTVEVKC